MTNNKNTKRAFIVSVLALILCFIMLLGTTLAYLTDAAVSGNNVITAGNIDLEVKYTLDGTTWNNLDGATDLFQKGLWEPGHTEVVALKISNTGSLAMQYSAKMNITEETIGKTKDGADIVLSDILTVSTFACDADDEGARVVALAFDDENGIAYTNKTSFNDANVIRNEISLLADGEHYVIVKVDMDAALGNEVNHNGINVPSINFGINVSAAQFDYEEDTFGTQYDADVQIPEILFVKDATELKSAVSSAPQGAVVYLEEGEYVISNQVTIDQKSINIIGTGNTVVRLSKANEKAFYVYGDTTPGNSGINVTIANVTIEGNNAKADIWVRSYGRGVQGNVNLTLDNVTCATVIADNNYDDNTVINVNVKNSRISKITLDAAPFGGNGKVTYTNLTYDAATVFGSIMIQDRIEDAGMANVTINGNVVTARGEQLR